MSPALVAAAAVFAVVAVAGRGLGDADSRLRRLNGGPSSRRGPGSVGAAPAPTPRPRTPPTDPAARAEDAAALAHRLAALARAGLGPAQAWAVLERAEPDRRSLVRIVLRTTALGGTVAEGLRTAAPRDPALAGVALACHVSETAGAGLADVLDGLAGALLADAHAVREREAVLAGPRATAAILTWLPVAGLLLAAVSGADPVAVLLGSPMGRVCLGLGVALWLLGRRWVARLVARAEAA